MGKNKNKGTRRDARANTSTTSDSSGVKVIGVLADDSVIRTANVADLNIQTAIDAIANDLQTHINSTFSLREDGITIDTETVLIPGVLKHDSDNTVSDVFGQLPPGSPYMVVLYSPIHAQRKLLTNTVNQMAIDQSFLAVAKNAPPWPSSPDGKLDQIMYHIKILNQEVVALKADNVALNQKVASLAADNVTLNQKIASQDGVIGRLKAQVNEIEEDNQDLREAVDGQTVSLYKLRRRILLDQARKKILKKWAPHNSKLTWNELCDAMMESELKSFISLNGIFARPLHEDAFIMIYDGRSVVREHGNEVAHEANKELVRDAIVYGDPEDVNVLKNIFGCVYGEDLL